MIAEAPMTFETEAVIPQEPEIPDLVPSETSASPIIEPVGGSSFPKVLRSRLDSFFADQEHFA
jgi:linoleoyl-CoA desaturase